MEDLRWMPSLPYIGTLQFFRWWLGSISLTFVMYRRLISTSGNVKLSISLSQTNRHVNPCSICGRGRECNEILAPLFYAPGEERTGWCRLDFECLLKVTVEWSRFSLVVFKCLGLWDVGIPTYTVQSTVSVDTLIASYNHVTPSLLLWVVPKSNNMKAPSLGRTSRPFKQLLVALQIYILSSWKLAEIENIELYKQAPCRMKEKERDQ